MMNTQLPLIIIIATLLFISIITTASSFVNALPPCAIPGCTSEVIDVSDCEWIDTCTSGRTGLGTWRMTNVDISTFYNMKCTSNAPHIRWELTDVLFYETSCNGAAPALEITNSATHNVTYALQNVTSHCNVDARNGIKISSLAGANNRPVTLNATLNQVTFTASVHSFSMQVPTVDGSMISIVNSSLNSAVFIDGTDLDVEIIDSDINDNCNSFSCTNTFIKTQRMHGFNVAWPAPNPFRSLQLTCANSTFIQGALTFDYPNGAMIWNDCKLSGEQNASFWKDTRQWKWVNTIDHISGEPVTPMPPGPGMPMDNMSRQYAEWKMENCEFDNIELLITVKNDFRLNVSNMMFRAPIVITHAEVNGTKLVGFGFHLNSNNVTFADGTAVALGASSYRFYFKMDKIDGVECVYQFWQNNQLFYKDMDVLLQLEDSTVLTNSGLSDSIIWDMGDELPCALAGNVVFRLIRTNIDKQMNINQLTYSLANFKLEIDDPKVTRPVLVVQPATIPKIYLKEIWISPWNTNTIGFKVQCEDADGICNKINVDAIRYFFKDSYNLERTTNGDLFPCGREICEANIVAHNTSVTLAGGNDNTTAVFGLQELAAYQTNFSFNVYDSFYFSSPSLKWHVGRPNAPLSRLDKIDSFEMKIGEHAAVENLYISINTANVGKMSQVQLLNNATWSMSSIYLNTTMDSWPPLVTNQDTNFIFAGTNSHIVQAGAGTITNNKAIIYDDTGATNNKFQFDFIFDNCMIEGRLDTDGPDTLFYYTSHRDTKNESGHGVSLTLRQNTVVETNITSIIIQEDSTGCFNCGFDNIYSQNKINIQDSSVKLSSIVRGTNAKAAFKGMYYGNSYFTLNNSVFSWTDGNVPGFAIHPSVEVSRYVFEGAAPEYISIVNSEVMLTGDNVSNSHFVYAGYGNSAASTTVQFFNSNLTISFEYLNAPTSVTNQEAHFAYFVGNSNVNINTIALVSVGCNMYFRGARYVGLVRFQSLRPTTIPPTPFYTIATLHDSTFRFVSNSVDTGSALNSLLYEIRVSVYVFPQYTIADNKFYFSGNNMGDTYVFSNVNSPGYSNETGFLHWTGNRVEIECYKMSSGRIIALSYQTNGAAVDVRMNHSQFIINSTDSGNLVLPIELIVGPGSQFDFGYIYTHMQLHATTSFKCEVCRQFDITSGGPSEARFRNIDMTGNCFFNTAFQVKTQMNATFEHISVKQIAKQCPSTPSQSDPGVAFLNAQLFVSKVTLYNVTFEGTNEYYQESVAVRSQNSAGVEFDITNSRFNITANAQDAYAMFFNVFSNNFFLFNNYSSNYYIGPGTVVGMITRQPTIAVLFNLAGGLGLMPTCIAPTVARVLANFDSVAFDLKVTEALGFTPVGWTNGQQLLAVVSFLSDVQNSVNNASYMADCFELYLHKSTVNIETVGDQPVSIAYNKQLGISWMDVFQNTFNIPQYSYVFYSDSGYTYRYRENTINYQYVATAVSQQSTLLLCNNTNAAGRGNNCPFTTILSNNSFNNADGGVTAVAATVGPIAASRKIQLDCNHVNGTEYYPSVAAPSWDLTAELVPCATTTTANVTTSTNTTTATNVTMMTNVTTNVTTNANTSNPNVTTATTPFPSETATTTTITSPVPTVSNTTANPSPPGAPTTNTTPTTTSNMSTNTTATPLVIATLPPIPTVAEIVATARQTEQDAEVAVTSTAAGGALLSMPSPGLITLASRAGLVTRLVSCESSLNEALPFYLNPTGLELDVGSRSTTHHVGAIVANMAITLGFGLFSVLVAFIHGFASGRPDERSILGFRYRSLGAARFTGSLVFPLLFFMQPFIGSSLTVLVHGNTTGAVIAVVVILLTLLISASFAQLLRDKQGFLATYRTKEELTFDKMMTERENAKAGKFVKEEQKSCLDSFGEFYETRVEGLYGWWFEVPLEYEDLDYEQREKVEIAKIRDHEGHKYFLKRYGASFDYYNSEYRWFLIFEIAASICLGICDGLVESIGCSKVAIICCVVFGLYVISVFAIRPYSTRKDFVFCGLVTLFNFAGAILTALPEGTLDETEKERDIIFVSSAALFIGTVQAAEGILANGTRWLIEKCTEDGGNSNNKDNSKEVPLVEVGKNNGTQEVPTNNNNNNNNNNNGVLQVPSMRTSGSAQDLSHHQQQQQHTPREAPYVATAAPPQQREQIPQRSRPRFTTDEIDDDL